DSRNRQFGLVAGSRGGVVTCPVVIEFFIWVSRLLTAPVALVNRPSDHCWNAEIIVYARLKLHKWNRFDECAFSTLIKDPSPGQTLSDLPVYRETISVVTGVGE
ncbi:MAG: hypothetical protein ACYSWQ_18105, partial [Planctomycetota bacterium]